MAYEGDFNHNGWVRSTVYYSFDLGGTWRNDYFQDWDGYENLGTLSVHWRERFEAAMDEWEAVASIHFIETTASEADLIIGWYSFDGQYGAGGDATWLDQNGDGWLDRAHGDGSVIRMDPDDSGVFFQIAVHELGHVLGLGHIEHTPSIMAKEYTLGSSPTTPTAYDVQVIRELYGPPGSSLPSGPSPALVGTDYADHLIGTAGADEIYGRNGADTIKGMGGNDTLFGNIGTDWLDGGGGDDLIFAGQNGGPLRIASDGSLRHLDGNDWLWGGTGNDTLCGQYGFDGLEGGGGDDALFGGKGSDTLWGGPGNDVIAGNRGDDWLSGGTGSDRFYFGHNSGNDTIMEPLERIDGGSRDLIYIQADVNGSGIRTSHDVLARMHENSHGEAVIDLGAGNSITMLEHDTAWFTASDFIIY